MSCRIHSKYCKIKGCKGKYFSLGYCVRHYSQFLRAGTLPGRKKCKVWGCKRGCYAKGLCRIHYSRFQKTGTTFLQEWGEVCKVFNCKTPARILGFCVKHYDRWKKYGNCYKRKGGAPKGKKNWNWSGGVSEYPHHATLKKNRLIKLKQVGWKCELCGKFAYQTFHKNKNKTDHRRENLLAVCTKCLGKCKVGLKYKSVFFRMYGLTLKEMVEAFGRTNIYYTSLHKEGRLKKFLLKIKDGEIEEGK